MHPAVWVMLAVGCQFFLVAGQIFFKRAMRETPQPQHRSKIGAYLGLGIFMMTLWFMIWVNLLEQHDLSRIFPFEGLNPVLMVAAAWIFLKERLSLDSALGVLLICGGIFLASSS